MYENGQLTREHTKNFPNLHRDQSLTACNTHAEQIQSVNEIHNCSLTINLYSKKYQMLIRRLQFQNN